MRLSEKRCLEGLVRTNLPNPYPSPNPNPSPSPNPNLNPNPNPNQVRTAAQQAAGAVGGAEVGHDEL